MEADRSKGGKTDLNKSSMVTVGSDHDRDKYGRVLKSKHVRLEDSAGMSNSIHFSDAQAPM